MNGADFGFGDEIYESRSELRAVVWEISGGRCEHPGAPGLRGSGPSRCGSQATELAHIESIGMGGRSSADTINNVLSACPTHARSTDDHSSSEWDFVPPPHDCPALAGWLLELRRRQGWAL